MIISRNWACLFSFFLCVVVLIFSCTGRVIPTKRTLGLAPVLAVLPRVELPPAEATPSSKAPELQQEVFEGDGQVDVTHGMNKMALDGQL